MRTLRKSRDRRIAGVAAGFAEYLDLDVTLVRAIWLFGCIAFPPTLLAYFVLAAFLPPAPGYGYQSPYHQAAESPIFEAPRRRYRRLVKSPDRWLFGVCGGIAEYFDVDPVLVRALWLAAVLAGGVGVGLYILLAILMPRAEFQY